MKKFEFRIFREKAKKFFTGEVSSFISILILPTYRFFRRLRIAFQTCTRIFLIITWQPCKEVSHKKWVMDYLFCQKLWIIKKKKIHLPINTQKTHLSPEGIEPLTLYVEKSLLYILATTGDQQFYL